MRVAVFGATGKALPLVGQGTWNMEADDRRSAIAALRRGLDLELTHVDTAQLYGDGEVEELVGEALDGRRDEAVLVTKVLPDEASREGTVRACEASLRRLRTDHLDGYLLHWLGPHPFEETVAGMEELVERGLIRWWGVSNFDEIKLGELLEVAGPGRVACNQVLHHLEEREIEHAVLPFCGEHGIAVVGYSPFGSGDFPAPGTSGRAVLDAVAEAHDASAYQVALAFLLRQGVFTIPKTSDVDHVEDNASAADLVLTDEEAARVDAAFPRGPRRWGVPML